MDQPLAGGGEPGADPRAPQASLLDRLLRVFTEVEPGEAGTALLMFLNLFLLLLGYYVLRTLREPLILASGAEVKSYAAAGQALALMGFVPLYGWFASKVGRARLILGFILFFVACIELFSLAGRAHLPYVGVVFYVWVGIFSLATIAQFWSFANDVYRREAGERLFPFIFLGATLGAPVGAWLAGQLFKAGISPYSMMHVTTERALDQVTAWLESPTLVLLAETEGHGTVLRELIRNGRVSGAAVHDARIAALCLHYGVRELWTADRDFGRFPALTVRNPLVG